jgi:putative ABC transport system permease protein
VALLLAAAGIYGVVSYAVAQRTREIGIRMALGARPRQVQREVLGQGLVLVFLGLVSGLVGTLWTTSLLKSLLFGVSVKDPLTYAAVEGGVVCVAALANIVPACRTASVDPMRALRSE